MDNSWASYLPVDRLNSLLKNRPLPAESEGAVLFADICGFTPLTEKLVADLGPDRGADELTHLLNLVYSALIEQIELYHGSVIYFSGDAITCWWSAEETAEGKENSLAEAIRAATSAAFALQDALAGIRQQNLTGNRLLATMGLKIALAAGKVRRFVVGQTEIQLIDVLAGPPLERLALADSIAGEGQIVAAPEIWQSLGPRVEVREWFAGDTASNHTSEENPQKLAILGHLHEPSRTHPWDNLTTSSRNSPATDPPPGWPDTLRRWVLPQVARRLESGLGNFLTELRPGVAVFIGVDGLDYTLENGELRLNALVCQVQTLLQKYEGALLQLTVGDKGTFLYAAFGVLVAHKNDAEQAVLAALTLLAETKNDPTLRLRIGISQGTMRTGSYGGRNRTTYGALGDEVNLAARLMQVAEPDQVLISERVRKRLGAQFKLNILPPLKVKGKSKPLTVFACATLPARTTPLDSASVLTNTYPGLLLGRQSEVGIIRWKMEQVETEGQGQTLEIAGGAGIGKSRLLAEAVRLAVSRNNWRVFIGQGLSFGTRITYLAWQPIFREIFGLEPGWPASRQIALITQFLHDLDPALEERLPLLGPLLNLAMADTDFSRTLEPEVRKNALEEFVVELLEKICQKSPILLVLEDCHWLDPLSGELLAVVSRTARLQSPLFILCSTRTGETEGEITPAFGLAESERLELGELSQAEARHLLTVRLEERLGLAADRTAPVVERLAGRGEGNPFYLEELGNWLCDHYNDSPAAGLEKLLDQLESVWPESLHSLVLSRLDRLSENEKAILKVASVIGRTFQPAWIWEIYPQVGEADRVLAALQHLEKLDITPLDPARPELAYTFKHMVTHEVAYRSLSQGQKEELHQTTGFYIEKHYDQGQNQNHPDKSLPLDLLAYHFGRSANRGKQRVYLALAGQQAQANFATVTALSYYRQLLELLKNEIDRNPATSSGNGPALEKTLEETLEKEWLETNYQLGRVLTLMGHWAEAETGSLNGLGRLESGLFSEAVGGTSGWRVREERTRLKLQLTSVYILQGRFPEATVELEEILRTAGPADLASGFSRLGWIALMQADYDQAQLYLEKSLGFYRNLQDSNGIASVYKNLSTLETSRGNGMQARRYAEQALELYRQTRDRPGIATSLDVLGTLLIDYQGDSHLDLELARRYNEEALSINREIGNRRGMAYNLNNLGVVADRLGDYDQARQQYEAQLIIRRELNDTRGLILALYNVGVIAVNYLDRLDLAYSYFEEGLTCGEKVNDKLGRAISHGGLGCVAYLRKDFATALVEWRESLEICTRIKARSYTLALFTLVAALFQAQGRPETAALLCGFVATQVRELKVNLDTLLDTADYKVFDQTVKKLQNDPGPMADNFEEEFARGGALSLDEALQLVRI